MKTTGTPKRPCLGCGAQNNAATETFGEEAIPSEGDASVCIYCGHISIFNADLTLRNPTDEEIHSIAGDERILKIQKARAEIDIKPWGEN